MAGIGFRLQKLITGESYTDLIRAYFYSSIISSGPMLLVMASLLAVKSIIQTRLLPEETHLFLTLVIYVYAASMIGVAPFLYIVTRYLADKYYLKEIRTFTPVYVATLELVFFMQGILALVFLWFTPFETQTKWLIYSLYLFVNGIWLAVLFLSAAQSYFGIAAAFFAGGVLGVISSYSLGAKYGFDGFLAGFMIGQGVTFGVLSYRILREFGANLTPDYGFLVYFKKHFPLAITGLAYYVGIWIDKFIFWMKDDALVLGGFLRTYPDYDTPMFLAFLTVVPSLAFFLVQMETSFVFRYHDYFRTIQERRSLDEIKSRQKAVAENLSVNFQRFLMVQGIMSGLVVLLVYPIADNIGLNPFQLGIFRIGILGAFLMMAFIILLNIMFYFEFKKEAAFVCVVLCVTNFVFTKITIHLGLPAYGFGYAAASFVSVILAYVILDRRLSELNYWTFMRQPVLVPKFKFEGEGKTPKT